MEVDIPNVSAWRLNKGENKELEERVLKGEDRKDVKREIQRRKAVACEERKRAAAASATKPDSSEKGKKRKTSSAVGVVPDSTAKSDPTNSAYYAEVESDLKTILKEFPGLEKEAPLPLSSTETDKKLTGVQEPYEVKVAKHTLELHHVYRSSMSLFSLNLLGSPTPGIPMSRRRVLDMASFYFPEGAPAYMTGRMVEVYVDRNSLSDRPENLQMVSPEEIVHSLIAACAQAIRCFGDKVL